MPQDEIFGLPCQVGGKIVYTIEEFRKAQDELKKKAAKERVRRGGDVQRSAPSDDLSPEVQAQVARMMAGKE